VPGVAVSAATGEGVDALVVALDEALAGVRSTVEFRVPFSRADVVARLHREGSVLASHAGEGETLVTALVTPKLAGQIRKALAKSC